jgi:hypothetical protein
MLSEGSRRWFTERRLCLRLLLKHALNCFSQSVDDLVVRDAMLARFDHCCRDRLGELAPSCNIRQRSAPSIRVRALSWITIANINLSDRWKVSIDSAKLIAFNKQFEQASDDERFGRSNKHDRSQTNLVPIPSRPAATAIVSAACRTQVDHCAAWLQVP